MNTNKNTKNSYSIEFDIVDGFVHIRESYPVPGEIVLHASLMRGFSDRILAFCAQMEGKENPK